MKPNAELVILRNQFIYFGGTYTDKNNLKHLVSFLRWSDLGADYAWVSCSCILCKGKHFRVDCSKEQIEANKIPEVMEPFLVKILSHINTEVERKKVELSTEVQLNMAFTLANYIVVSVDKYIKGQLEYGGDIRNKDLVLEREMESIDSMWYGTADDRWPRL